MTQHPLFDPADFHIPPGVTHVCAGGETPFLRRHAAALARYGADKSAGMPGRPVQEAEVERARGLAAKLWHCAPGDLGFVGSVADGVSMIAESIDWQPGDNVVLDLDEYPSVVAPFALRAPGLELRFATGKAADRLDGLVDARTRLIGTSHVSYLTGERMDLAGLRRLADSVGALLVVDHTQATGYLPVQADLADFAFAATYKWLLGMTGTAIAYWNRQRQPDWRPGSAGWYSLASSARPDYGAGLALREDALRFTRGNPAHGPVYVLAEALDYLSAFDMATVQRHVQGLTVELLGRLAEAGIPTTTPADPARHGASVCIESPKALAIVNAMNERQVFGWNGRGRIRFSFHGYNAMPDVDRIMEVLRAEWQG